MNQQTGTFAVKKGLVMEEALLFTLSPKHFNWVDIPGNFRFMVIISFADFVIVLN